mmetsp:Transcript_6741/g.20250  ORF Transcript_6741/g.20250 Transcript_6741/m.20250 type:complete len:200 (-) Transcript_6741:1068-1667(-)
MLSLQSRPDVLVSWLCWMRVGSLEAETTWCHPCRSPPLFRCLSTHRRPSTSCLRRRLATSPPPSRSSQSPLASFSTGRMSYRTSHPPLLHQARRPPSHHRSLRRRHLPRCHPPPLPRLLLLRLHRLRSRRPHRLHPGFEWAAASHLLPAMCRRPASIERTSSVLAPTLGKRGPGTMRMGMTTALAAGRSSSFAPRRALS